MEKLETATFAAGCFWGIEETFRKLPGVQETMVGYTGGKTEKPNYEDVCYQDTGHAEAIQIKFNPATISYENLLKVFWQNHDPTTKNRQGPDVGSQYRSAIFFHSPDQKSVAEKSLAEKQKETPKIIVTEIAQAQSFYPAEEYHQKYFMKRGGGACHI